MKFGICLYLAHLVICYFRTVTTDTIGNEPFCFRTKQTLGRTQCTFLRKLVSVDIFLFYWTVWTGEQSLAACSISADPEVIQNYLSLCHEENSGEFTPKQSLRLNVTLLLNAGSQCKFRTSGSSHLRWKNSEFNMGSQVGLVTKMRQKRAWTLPGTLWCGHGSNAAQYDQLGMFERADRCCRDHDHCKHVIRPFTVNFGIFNPTLFTMSHCDCDSRFKQCLLDVNDTVSNMVGYTFFNVLKLHCFDLIQKRGCTQISWFGQCTSVQTALFAMLRNPTAYNATSLNVGVSGSTRYLEKSTSYNQPKNAKSKKRKQTKKAQSTHAVAEVDKILSRKKFRKSYGRTKILAPSTTTQPSWQTTWSSALFHQKNQTKIQQEKSELWTQTSLLPPAANSTHTPTVTLPNKRKTMTSQKHITTVNTTLTRKYKTLTSKQKCNSKKSLIGNTFQPKQQRRKDCRLGNASKQKSAYLSSKFLIGNKLFVNKTKTKKAKFPSTSKLSNIVLTSSYSYNIATSTISSKVTKLAKTRKSNPSKSKKN